MVSKLSDTLKGKMVDGKLQVSPQEVVDLYYGMATQANADWQAQTVKLNSENEAACKARFSVEELSAAESGVAFVESRIQPGFRDFTKRQLNDPTLTALMVFIGESLQEDGFEPAGRTPASAAPDRRPLMQRAQDKLYPAKAAG